MGFADRLSGLIKEKGYSFEELGKLIGSGKSTVSSWVNAKVIPSRSRLNFLAKVLGVNSEWLLSGTGEKYAHPPEMFSSLKEEEMKYIARPDYEEEIIKLKAQNSLLRDQLREKDLIIKDLHMEVARLREECNDKNKKGRRSA